jgi:hypothetical protein
MTLFIYLKRSIFLGFLGAAMSGLCFANALDRRSETQELSDRNWHDFLTYFEPALKSSGGIGRLYYRGDCWTEFGEGISFPHLELERPSQSTVGHAALQAVFRKEKQVTIARSGARISRISIGNVSHDLLNTRIHVVAFTPTERYNVDQALLAIERTPEIEAKKRELKFEYPPTVSFSRVLKPAADLPHLPKSLKDVTMDEALDRVAETFGGFVSYGECLAAGGRRFFTIDFKYVR